jgi:hypothetical protein
MDNRSSILRDFLLKKNNLLLIIFFIIIITIYLLTKAANHTEAEDSLHFLFAISHGSLKNQFNPDHLLYNITNFSIFNLLRIFEYKGNAEIVVKLVNIFFGLLGLVTLYRITNHEKFSNFLKIFCISGVAFSYGYWWYSVECEVYISSIAFTLLSIHRLILIKDNFSNIINHLILGIFNAFAILFNKPHVLFIIVVLISYLLVYIHEKEKISKNEVICKGCLFLGSCTFIVLISYLIVGIYVFNFIELKQMINWASNLDRVTTGIVSKEFGVDISKVLKAPIGIARTICGLQFIFSFPYLSELLTEIFPNFILREEIFLVKGFTGAKRVSLIILFGINFIIICVLILTAIKKKFNKLINQKSKLFLNNPSYLTSIFIIYFVIFTIFNILFEPQHIELWLSCIPVIFFLLCKFLNPIVNKNSNKILMVIFIISLFYINLLGCIIPQTSLRNDYWYAFNSWIIKNCNQNDLIVTGSGYISDGYIKYFSKAKVLNTLGSDTKLLQNFINYAKEEKINNIYFTSTVINPTNEIVLRGNFDTSHAKEFFNKSKRRLRLVHSDSFQNIYLFE